VDRLRNGARIALVSDAGTPAISDPGADLVADAVQAGVRVEPVPGPSAVIAALVGSGLPTGRFVFEGFLPRTKPDRRERLAAVAAERRTTVLYEAPTRLPELLRELTAVCGPVRRVAVGREITKKFEEFVRGTLADVADHFEDSPARGELVVVLDGASGMPDPVEAAVTPESVLCDALARGLSPRAAARVVVEQTGMPRNRAYALAVTAAAGAETPTG
jgi:16S rRNA (cytidine1402-2'-O)-methyltransferase